jgi:deazaflavin-dependent oxidoreductase (nitroreductase family)
MWYVPLPPALGRFNARVTNTLTRPLARLVPGFGVVVHRGRRTGREYRTPVNVFHREGALIIPLTYGADAQWVRNVLGAGGCEVESRGRRHRYCAPAVVLDESRHLVPPGVRQALGVLNVEQFLVLEPCGPR